MPILQYNLWQNFHRIIKVAISNCDNSNYNTLAHFINANKMVQQVQILNEIGVEYGDNIIDEYSKKLVVEVGRKYNRRTFFRMKPFYNMFNDEKVSPMATQLTWSHYTELLSIKDSNKLTYYINVTKDNNLSKRKLREKN